MTAMALAREGFLPIGATRLEYRLAGPAPEAAPTIVLLHEGLGCAALWDDFPDRLAAATGAGVLAYSRAGYGNSSPAALPRPPAYMHDEAREVLPRVLAAVGFRRGLLLGHSDGASIAAIYAGGVQDHRVRGLILIAPHFFVEEEGLAAIRRLREAYARGALRARLARSHADPDNAFRGWSEAWLDPGFRGWDITESLAYIRVPVLVMQGERDRHGTLRQVEAAQEECYCPVEVALLPKVGHVPHREAPEDTLRIAAGFCDRILREHHEGEMTGP